MRISCLLVLSGLLGLALSWAPVTAQAFDDLEVGYAEVNITPEIAAWEDADGNGQYTYGSGAPYNTGEKVTGFVDGDIYIGNGNGLAWYVQGPLYSRVVVVADPHTGKKVAFVSLDLYMMLQPDVDFLRDLVIDLNFTQIAIHATHNHMGPDTLGRGGPDVFTNGINGKWFRKMQYRTAEAIRRAYSSRVNAQLRFLQTKTRFGLHDTRDPLIYDDDLVAMQAVERASGRTLVTLVQWSNHVETSLSISNGNNAPPEMKDKEGHIITPCFPYHVAKHAGEVFGGHGIFFNGAVGGLLTMLHTFVWEPFKPYSPDTPASEIPADYPGKIHDNFQMATLIGNELIDKLQREGLQNQPFADNLFVEASSVPFKVRLDNELFKSAFLAGIIGFDQRKFEGDILGKAYLFTRASRIDIGPAQFATIPGELVSEFSVGLPDDFVNNTAKYYRNPQYHKTGKDFVVKTHLKKMMSGRYKFVLGLTNDALGYMVNPCDFKLDEWLPWAEQAKGHYEETQSVGPEIIPRLFEAYAKLFTQGE